MKVIIADDYEIMSREAAKVVAAEIEKNPDCVLALPTGGTPLGFYAELVRMHKEEGLDFSRVTTFNLDEYLGLPETHKSSYAFYMYDNFFNDVNVNRDRVHIPRGLAEDPHEEAAAYEREIKKAGGIDLAVLGIGRNGHIGFNEPKTEFGSLTRPIYLAKRTIEANARFFDDDPDAVPRQAISMGIKTIMNSRKIILLANGPEKSGAIYQTIHGPVTDMVPSSVLQLHPDCTVFLDRDAASELKPPSDDVVQGPGIMSMVY
ncbi:MAG: glucosamine-6-phosphate deaminase [Bacillota bacterium]|jgi:glucosamine-6-phosphate deaminase|nr:glucosamine-6-phosphate deaminase [Bacillota bacterium]MDI9415011.1 glucosamine-6-phosphate deaminase [Bacillota bacterium]NLD12742.1 glucosamine-6-phosphate deaminase [Bacillota bacterium]HAV21856.1 glucosamine-6-phosphate deaminase [Bacillota bacterium]HOB88733.1 glucosamine-6-phosphate deaminase [Bacillota bacterium]